MQTCEPKLIIQEDIERDEWIFVLICNTHGTLLMSEVRRINNIIPGVEC